MSQEKLAEKAELASGLYRRIGTGRGISQFHALIRIAKALGVRVRDLVDEL